jgi:hypothetical protein
MPNFRNMPRIWAVWWTVVEPVNVRKQNEGLRVSDMGDKGCEAVVVTQPDFIGCNRVVFINNREHIKFE